MKGTRKFFSILTALALCLSLLPGTAWALDNETGVTFANGGTEVTLTDGGIYVAAADNNGIEKVDTEPDGGGYLEYNNGTLTVHGAFETTATIYVYSNLTITGDADSSLSVNASHGITVGLDNASDLTMDGGVDFTGNSGEAPVIQGQKSGSIFRATENYSGDIVINSAVTIPAVSDVSLDVKNSKSITITGKISSERPAVLQSAGNVSITTEHSPITPAALTIKGVDVKLTGSSDSPVFYGESLNIEAAGDVLITNENEDTRATPAIVGSAEISAGGDVTISSGSLPVVANVAADSLTVKNARNVSITGKSSESYAFFPVPVTFEDCGKVSVTDNGNGQLMADDVTVTSDNPWAATTGGKAVTMPSGSLSYGGDIPQNGLVINSATAPTYWKAEDGWVFYEPPAGEGSPATLTLDNATYADDIAIDVGASVSVVAKGENRVDGAVMAIGSVTVNEANGSLNTFVVEGDADARKIDYTVYGEVELPADFIAGKDPDPDSDVTMSLTVRPGAELTIPSDCELEINDFTWFNNNGTIVNNGAVTLKGTAATNASAETVRSLGLTGSGKVEVSTVAEDGSAVTTTYTNSGVKLLAPAGTNGALDLSNADSADESHWSDQGYKWEVTKGADGSGNEIITSAKLTLAEGFNATSVTLPDAAVEIVTTGESSIEELVGYNISGSGPQKTELTFSGTGLLTITEHVEISGGAGNTITVAAGAKVTANNGISIGASGGIDSTITVNGTLTAAQGTGTSAIYGGKVEIGNTGVLEVSGENGVQLNGMTNDFRNLFTVSGNGRFTADCNQYNIRVNYTDANKLPKDEAGNPDAKAVINLGDEYMPDDCKVELDSNAIKLMRRDENGTYNECKGPLTIHKNHTWGTGWTWDTTTHWHTCTFAGCTEKQPGSEAAHFYRSCVCTVCGYRAPAGTPDSDSGSSGGDSGGDSGSSSGGGSHETTYTVTVEKAEHGKVTSDRRTASLGRTVTLTVSPDEGYEAGTLTVTDRSGKTLDVTDKGGGEYTFIMPGGNVSVRAVFNKITADYEACARDSSCPIWPFVDADANAWYHDGVHYCLGNGLMSGYDDHLFGPNAPLSRAQFAQILHNCEGRPAVNYLMQFVDISGKEWYAEAVRWAASEGVVSGYGNGMFGPDDNITREQLALMLWRYAGSPAATEKELEFSDTGKISDYAIEALQWAVENGIVTGGDVGVLDPQGQATRAEAAAMLMRYLGK